MTPEVYAREFLPPEERHVVLDGVARFGTSGANEWQGEHSIIRRDGELRYLVVRCVVTYDGAGRPIGTRGVNQDITERRRDHEKHVRSERLLQAVTDGLPGLVSQWNRDLVCTFANRAYHDWFGESPNKVVGMRLRDVIGDEAFLRAEPHLLEVLAGRPQAFEQKLKCANDSVKECWAQLVPDIAADGAAVNGYFALVSDITDVKRKEDALRQSEGRFRSVIAAMAEGVVLQQAEGIIIDCNPQAALIIGSSRILMGEIML